jgi:integrase/recombinase XerD
MTFTHYLQHLQHSAATIRTYGKYLDYLTSWLQAAQLNASELTYTELLDFIGWLQDKGKSKRVVSSVLGVLRHYFTYLITAGLRTDNPAAGVFIRGLPRRLPGNLFMTGELQQLYDQYRLQLRVGLSKKIMLGLFVYQGLTTGEIGRLQATDIRLNEGKVFIRGSRYSNERWLKLEAVQVVDLQIYLKANKFKEGVLLVEQKKGFIGRNNITNQVAWMMKQLRQLHPKVTNAGQLRSSVIASWLKQHNLRQVQYMAGHRYVSSTQRYEQCNLDGLQQAVARHHPMR